MPRGVYGRQDAYERFWDKVKIDFETGCWEWQAHTNFGYGVFWHEGYNHPAHRWLYEYLNGPIAEGYDPDHVCRNRKCVNPGHIEIVTERENVLRGNSPTAVTYRTGICQRGHILEGANLRLKAKQGRIAHQCRACENMTQQERRAKKRELQYA